MLVLLEDFMAKNNRLDLRLEQKDKEKLIALAKGEGYSSVTKLIEGLINGDYVKINNKLKQIIKLYG